MSYLVSRIYLILLSIVFTRNLRADYLLLEHRDDGTITPVTARTPHSKDLFRVLLKYQFPANTNPVLDITPTERALLDANEQAFIQGKINDINPEILVVFIPSVLYELFITIKYITETQRDIAMKNIAWTLEFKLRKLIAAQPNQQIHITSDEQEQICTEVHTLITQQPTEANIAAIESELIARIKHFFTEISPSQKLGSFQLSEPITVLIAPFITRLSHLDTLYHQSRMMPDLGKTSSMEELYTTIAHTAETIIPMYQASNELLGNWLDQQSLLTIQLNSHGNRQVSSVCAQKALHSLARTIANLIGKPQPQRHDLSTGLSMHRLLSQLILYLGTRGTYYDSPFQGADHLTGRLPFQRGFGRILKEIVSIEYNAHEQEKAVLYRGTDECTLEKKRCLELPLFLSRFSLCEKMPRFHRVALGNSLFSGIFRDCTLFFHSSGANAFEFIGKHLIGYALIVDKKQYANDFCHNTHILNIPPYPSLVTLVWGRGESFHPCTREWKDSTLVRSWGGEMDISSNKKELARWYGSDLTQQKYIEKFAQLFGSRDTVIFLKSHADPSCVEHRDFDLEDLLLENTRSLTLEALAPYLTPPESKA